MDLTDDELATLQALITDWGFEYSLRADRDKVDALKQKINSYLNAPHVAPDVCTAYPDGLHRYDIDTMTERELLLSSNALVATSIMPPRGCACGRVILAPF